MSSEKKLQPNVYTARKYNAKVELDFDMGVKYSRVLLAIAGADGELADDELQWYIDEVTLMGSPQEYIDAIRNIDWKNVDIKEELSGVVFDFPLNVKRSLLYQAIKMSRADGVFHEKEKAAVAGTAEVLGVEKNVMESLKCVIEMEDSAEQLLRLILSCDI
ncbi:MAG: hypothetical protein F6K47_16030 [Symploca sp. SIO2E6]|nr:hypothetical protein [Symploca sp. SIO2E6]